MKPISILRLIVSSSVAALTFPPLAFGAPEIPSNLGGGLRALVKSSGASPSSRSARSAPGATGDPLVTIGGLNTAITNERGAVMVNIVLNGKIPHAQVAATLGAGVVEITATDAAYREGIIEGYVDLDDVVALAKAPGVQAVHLVHAPIKNVGATTSQGVVQHRVDQLSGVDGTGIKVGVLSDTFNKRRGSMKAEQDIASGDLPGPGNPLGHLTPVEVLAEPPLGTDEGRAMLQIVHDLAPGAQLAFATAARGPVDFADNIRALADAGCDIIVDDILYFNEPMFSDGLIAKAVDDVAARGVSFFSAAGNLPATQAYRGSFKPVGVGLSPGDTIPGTNCVLPPGDEMDPSEYAGGFHSFSATEVDGALLVEFGTQTILDLQWDDPYDLQPVKLGPVISTGKGTVSEATPHVDFPFAGTAGQRISIFADADDSAGNPIRDLVITLLDPAGRHVWFEDVTTNPEQLVSFLAMTGTYTARITGYEDIFNDLPPATGDFTVRINDASVAEGMTSDYNIFVFRENGDYTGEATDHNFASRRPVEILAVGTSGPLNLQVVFARANTPPASIKPAENLRAAFFNGGGRLLEHFSYDTPVTFGHSAAAGANSVATYAFFAPSVPEPFTSTGPVTIYLDQENRRLAKPEIRLKPDMAAMDGGNTTFFGTDAVADADTFPNFFGTSAAAPHAAAIAALVLQANGGPGSVTPKEMRKVLQKSAFLHDLDPSAASGSARVGNSKITLTARGDGSATSQFDNDSIRISLTGPGKLAEITLDLTNANPTQSPRGLVFDTLSPQLGGYPLAAGTFVGLTPADITPSFGAPTGAPGQFQKLTFTVRPGSFTGGESFGFGVDRDELAIGAGGGSASLLGGGVLFPSGALVEGGATFSGKMEDGTSFSGVFTNRIGRGHSRLDGFGFINAEAAVSAELP